MTVVDGSVRLVRRDNNGNHLNQLTGPIEGRYLRVSDTDPRQQITFFSGGLIRQPGRFQFVAGDNTGTAEREPGLVQLSGTDPADGRRRVIFEAHSDIVGMPVGTTGLEANAPGDFRQQMILPFNYPGVFNEGSHIVISMNPDTNGVTIESEECYAGVSGVLTDRRGQTMRTIWGLLDGVKNDASTLGMPTFGQRGTTETADDLVLAGMTDIVDFTVPIGFTFKPGWGGPARPVVMEPGDQIAITFNPDASPAGSVLESEDAHIFKVPITLIPIKGEQQPKLIMAKHSNTAADDDFHFNTTSDVASQGGRYSTVGYYEVPFNMKAVLGHPMGGPSYIYIDKA